MEFTRQNVERVDGGQLWLFVAENVMGWKWEKADGEILAEQRSEDRSIVLDVFRPGKYKVPTHPTLLYPRNRWAWDDGAALNVLKVLVSNSFHTQINMWDHSPTVHIVSSPRVGHGTNIRIDTTAANFATAVCRAACLAALYQRGEL
jgi:hypothetical protein